VNIKKNLEKIFSEVPAHISIVAVSKKKPIEDMIEAINAGVKIIGENKVQEAEEKYFQLKELLKEKKVEFHFIGHLQTNKVKKAVEIFNLIQTIDSIKLSNEISKRAKEINKVQKVLIQINIGEEHQKYGIKKELIFDFLEKVQKFENIKIDGLMCILPFGKDPVPYFKEMKKIFDKTHLNVLSMGMSSDYLTAIKYGSNMVRIGTNIFGKREQ